jgi:hypothetical protein
MLSRGGDEMIEQGLGRGRRIGGVEYIARNQQGIGLLLLQSSEQPVKETTVFIFPGNPVQGVPQMPVGCMNQTHIYPYLIGLNLPIYKGFFQQVCQDIAAGKMVDRLRMSAIQSILTILFAAKIPLVQIMFSELICLLTFFPRQMTPPPLEISKVGLPLGFLRHLNLRATC